MSFLLVRGQRRPTDDRRRLTTRRWSPAELKQEIWDERKHDSLLDLLEELESLGLIESAVHFRLTGHGRSQLPSDYQPPLRYGTGIPWEARR